MPNMTPDELNDRATEARATRNPGFPCASGACVNLENRADGTGVIVTSTRRPGPMVEFDDDEWARFIDEVRTTSKWDHTVRQVATA